MGGYPANASTGDSPMPSSSWSNGMRPALDLALRRFLRLPDDLALRLPESHTVIAPLRRVGISAGRCTASVVRVFGKSFLKLRRLRQLRHLETSGKLRLTSTCRHSEKNKPNAQRARHGTPSPPSREDYSTAKDEFAGRPSKSSLMTIHAAENPSAARKTQETGPA